MIDKERIEKAVELALRFGQTGENRHKMWVIDQMLNVTHITWRFL